MASCMCCLRRFLDGNGFGTAHTKLSELPSVKLDTSHMGQDVVIVKNGKRICGTGAALTDVPIVQDKAYYECKIQSTGAWGIGVATTACDLNKIPVGTTMEAWVLRDDGVLFHDNTELSKVNQHPQEGDIVGITYNHEELNFYLNGTKLSESFRNIRGTVYPVFYVDQGAVLDVQFSKFYHVPPEGFSEIMIEKSLL